MHPFLKLLKKKIFLPQPGSCVSRPAHILPESGPSTPSAREGRQSSSWHLPRGALPASLPQNWSYWWATVDLNNQAYGIDFNLEVEEMMYFFCLFSVGPYMLGTGLLIYMLSKEIYVINHETFAAASIGAVFIYGVKKFGPQVAAFADKLNEVGWNMFVWIAVRSFFFLQ